MGSLMRAKDCPVLGAKHPALGQPVAQCWSEIYDVLRPLILTPLQGGPPTWSEDLLLEIRRHDFLEETHWTVAYSPVPDETTPNRIGGVLATVHEITAQVVGQRRNALLRELGVHSVEAKSAEEACTAAASIFARYAHDVPFALLYLLDRDLGTARLAAATGLVPGAPGCPCVVDLSESRDAEGWPIARAVSVDSELGRGTTFTVTVPTGSDHLPPDHIQAPRAPVSTSIAQAFVEEASGWLGEVSREPRSEDVAPMAQEELAEPARSTRLLVADDNADMRAYLERLLRPLGAVELVRDGREALAAIERRMPDLVLSDVMMPNLDGLGLMRALRQDPRTMMLPIVLLSARAGEESRVEGVSLGADDYIVKPFSARELVARVRSQLQLARLRREHAEELREAEEQLRQAAATAAANAVLEDTNKKLLEIDRQRDEFIAMLSHELRNPLSPITSGLELLARAAPGSERARRAMSVIGRQLDHLRRIVDDLLDVTRIASGKVSLAMQLVELNVTIRETVDVHLPELAKAGVELRFEPAPTPVWTNADPTRLAQVLGNLLQNAAKFTPSGGEAVVSISTIGSGTGARAVIRVADTGRGIEPALLERLFEPFAQADTSLDRQKGGLGLGLAVAKGLVELHGGTLSAHSDDIGQGTTMLITLPLEEGTSRADLKDRLIGPTAGRRVLVIEDNEDARDVLQDLLELEGHAVEAASDGEEGYAKARVFRPDVVICDIGLPRMDGYEVARRIRADPDLRRATLIALSGYAHPKDVDRGRRAGFDAHLAKPLDFSAVLRLLEQEPPTPTG